MSVTRMRQPDHRCELSMPGEGEVVRCDECGRWWLGHNPPNPDYIRWTRLTWLGRWVRGLT